MSGMPEWTDPVYAAVADYCCERTGLTFPIKRPAETERKIRQAMDEAGIARPSLYLARLANDKALLDALVDRMVIGETFFFRERSVFTFLRKVALPELLARRHPGHTLQLWSAGCASGEEAYTLSIVLEEEGLAARSRVIGTDISRAALARATLGLYSDWSMRGVEEAVKRRYFHQRDQRWAIRSRFRDRTAFRVLNLADDCYPALATETAGLDVILCRNVLIYLAPQAVARVAQGFFRSLAEGGWLFTGAADPPLSDLAPFETVVTDQGVFYRRAAATDRPTIRLGHAPPPPADEPPQPPPRRAAREAAGRTPGRGARLLQAVPRLRKPAPQEITVPDHGPALDDAARALANGDYEAVLGALAEVDASLHASLLAIRALANMGRIVDAEVKAAGALTDHPMCGELHFLHAMLLVERGRDEEARPAMRRALYLCPDRALAHFSHATLLVRKGRLREAARAFRVAHRLAASQPPDAPLPWSDGQSAGSLAQAAEAQIQILETMEASG
jgi:chemotaxis protein methyltransferase CheR